jgi:hypothetical protein
MKKLAILLVFAFIININTATETIYINDCNLTPHYSNATYIFTNDVSTSSPVWCFAVSYTTNAIIDCYGHTITASGGGIGIFGMGNTNLIIRNCVIKGNFGYGMQLSNSQNTQIYNNTINTSVSGSNNIDGIFFNDGVGDVSLNTNIFNNVIAVDSPSGLAKSIEFGGTADSGNQILANAFYSDIWIDDAGTLNTYNTATYGNIYHAYNGTPAYSFCNITTSTNQPWANQGTDLPFNATRSCMSGRWLGNGADYHPYTIIGYNPYQNASNEKLVQIYVVDNTFAPMYNVSVQINQTDAKTLESIYLGSYLVDNFGSITKSLMPATQIYHFTVVNSSNTTLQDYASMAIPCTSTDLVCKLVLIVNPNVEIGYVNTYGSTNGLCNWDNATGYLNCTSVGSTIKRTALYAYYNNATAYQRVCLDTINSAGMVECTLNSSIQTCYHFMMNATYTDGERRTLVAGEVCTYERGNMGLVGVFAAFILVCAFTGMGVYFGAPGSFIGMATGLTLATLFGFVPAVMFPIVIVMDIVLCGIAAYMVRGS